MATDLVTYTAFEGGANLAQLIEENLGGEQLSAQDLPRVTMASGGSTTFEVPALEGVRAVSELRGIVVHNHRARRYWPQGSPVGDQPPACASNDGETGYGDRGLGLDGEPIDPDGAREHKCASCPWAQFGTAEQGSGQACTAQHVVYLLTPGQILPTVLTIPPTSLRTWINYLARLTTSGASKYGVETVFTLEAASNSFGRYSRIVVRSGEQLDEIQAEQARDYGKRFEQLL